jgi:alpha-amylase
LFGLPDLNTETEEVKSLLFKWIGDSVIAKYGFDAIRIGTVRHIRMRFWEELSQYLNDVPVFHIGEVMVREPSRVAEYQTKGGLDGFLDYPMYYDLQDAFNWRKHLSVLRDSYITNKLAFRDFSTLGVFLDNHDVERVLNQLSKLSPEECHFCTDFAYISVIHCTHHKLPLLHLPPSPLSVPSLAH